MVKVRQDAWSHEDDLLLAETVLRHIREGSTQLKAFDEVGDRLNRTSAACGFRWNAEIRKKYTDAIDLAKRQRKEKKRALEKQAKEKRVMALPEPTASMIPGHFELETSQELTSFGDTASSGLTIDQVIQYLLGLKEDMNMTGKASDELKKLEAENGQLTEQVRTLEQELAETRTQLKTIQDDYSTFIRIMDRARKMTVLEEDAPSIHPAFRMDQNGNLEQMIQNSN